ncbi:hypothetical protein AJ79_06580, partial [Helicocarpus griseus UAMH5409]
MRFAYSLTVLGGFAVTVLAAPINDDRNPAAKPDKESLATRVLGTLQQLSQGPVSGVKNQKRQYQYGYQPNNYTYGYPNDDTAGLEETEKGKREEVSGTAVPWKRKGTEYAYDKIVGSKGYDDDDDDKKHRGKDDDDKDDDDKKHGGGRKHDDDKKGRKVNKRGGKYGDDDDDDDDKKHRGKDDDDKDDDDDKKHG